MMSMRGNVGDVDSYVYDYDSAGILTGFFVTSAEAEDSASLIQSPLETGQQSFDNKVVEPRVVRVVGYASTAEDDAFTNFDMMLSSKEFKFFQVMIKGVLIKNLALEKVKKTEESESPDLSKVELMYREVMLVQTASSKPKDPAHSATSSTGRV